MHVEGPVKQEKQIKSEETSKTNAGIGIKVKPGVELTGDVAYSKSSQESAESKECHEGNEIRIVNFQFLMSKTSKIAEYVAPKRLWLLIDEWSTVPLDLQSHLADLLRRSFFSIPNVSVKIAAIEQRSAFKADRSKGGYIGIELGADASVALNLDDYLVYASDQERSIQVFRRLIRNHVTSICNEDGIDLGNSVYENWTSYAFTQDNVFVELVKACEGVPRDAMHILQNAAQRTPTAQISAPVLRYAALQFFQVEKDNAISSNPMNRKLLDWIRFKIIDQRNTRAFLLRVGTVDKLIDNLFDLRALHILSRSVSAAHRPGERYVVYKIDYGCYVDLTNNDKFPSGGLFADDPSFEINFDVPDDDRRSYRRAILDLDEFYKSVARQP